jgi:hypothetical protein
MSMDSRTPAERTRDRVTARYSWIAAADAKGLLSDIDELQADANLAKQLCAILMRYCGEAGPPEGEGAVETLARIADELDAHRAEIAPVNVSDVPPQENAGT